MFQRNFFHRNYLYLTGIVCGIVLGRMLPGMYIGGVLLLALTLWFICRKLYREMLMLTAAAAAGTLSAFICCGKTHSLPVCRVEKALVEICDSSAVGKAWNVDDLQPRRLIAKYDDQYIQLQFPSWMNSCDLLDREKYRVSGVLYGLDMPPEFFQLNSQGEWRDVSKEFYRSSYQDFLQRNGIKGVLILDSIEPDSAGKTTGQNDLLLMITEIRRTLAQRLDKDLDDPVNRAIIGAVTLGLRHRLAGDEKRSFAEVGLAHLFSISGLHVGVLAMLLLLILRPLPGWLHIPLIGTLICYVLMVGGNAPAVRAFAMILGAVIFRSFLLRSSALEVLSLICGIFLLFNPFYLTDGGFLYSFVITAVLIRSAEFGRYTACTFAGEGLLIGELSRGQRLFARWRGKLAGGIFFAAVAAAASSMLTLFFQNMFFAGSMFVNLLILPVLLPLYLLAIGKLLLPGLSCFWNPLLNALVNYLKMTSEIANQFTQHSSFMGISYLTVLIFSLLLLLFFTVIYQRKSLAVMAILLLISGFVNLRSSMAPERVHCVIYGGRVENPVAAIILPRAHTMYLLNINNEAVPLLRDIAVKYGISRVDRLDFGRPVLSNADGVDYLRQLMFIAEYRKSNLPVRSKKFSEKTAELDLQPGAESNSLSMNKAADKPEITLSDSEDGTLIFCSQDKQYKLERSRYPRAYIIERTD